jgi:hypothetical protein
MEVRLSAVDPHHSTRKGIRYLQSTGAHVAGCRHDRPTPAEASGKQTYFFRSANAKPWTLSPTVGWPTLTTRENNSKVSASTITVTDPHGRIRNGPNTRLYFAPHSPVKFEVDAQEFMNKNDNVILITRGRPHDYSAGNARLLLVGQGSWHAAIRKYPEPDIQSMTRIYGRSSISYERLATV